MNLDELKPLWKLHQQEICQRESWDENQLHNLLNAQTVAIPWYAGYQRPLLNLSVCLFWLVLASGC